jgi:hypothetical protein
MPRYWPACRHRGRDGGHVQGVLSRNIRDWTAVARYVVPPARPKEVGPNGMKKDWPARVTRGCGPLNLGGGFIGGSGTMPSAVRTCEGPVFPAHERSGLLAPRHCLIGRFGRRRGSG